MANLNIDSINKNPIIPALPIEVNPIALYPEVKVETGFSSASSIEKSKYVVPDITSHANSPLLPLPSLESHAAYAIGIDNLSSSTFINTMRLQQAEITNILLKGWAKGLEELKNLEKELVKSPEYIHKQKSRSGKGSTSSSLVGVGEGVASQLQFQKILEEIAALNQARTLERITPTEKSYASSSVGSVESSHRTANKPSASEEALLSAALIGGLVLGSVSLFDKATAPFSSVYSFIERVQPLVSQISPAQLIPVINLMIALPIYSHAWEEATNQSKSKERQKSNQSALNFAKDVIKMFSNPNFSLLSLLKDVGGIDHSALKQDEHIEKVLRFILVGVALSLLYSSEVGKLQGDQFGGILPQEFKELFNGNFSPNEKSKPLSEHQQLVLTLIDLAHDQLDQLPVQERELAVNALFDYVDQTQNINSMTKPKELFCDVLNGNLFKPISHFAVSAA